MLDTMRKNGVTDVLGNIIIYMNNSLSEDIIDYFFQNGVYESIGNKDKLFCEIDGFSIVFIY